MTELSIVVVNHNAGGFLTRCLASIDDACKGMDAEVVIVDNASSDGSTAAATSERPHVTVIHTDDNRGFARAANQGVRATRSMFVLLLNPDAEITGGSLEAFLKVARERRRVGALGALVRNSDGSLQPSARRVPSLMESIGHAFVGPIAPNNRFSRAYTMAGWDRSSEREVEWVSGSAMLLSREAFDTVGGFDEGYFMYVEDVDLCTRLRQGGWTVLFCPELEVIHQIGVSTRGQRGRMAFEHSRSIQWYYEKFHARGAGALLAPFVRAALWLRAAMVSSLRGRRG